MVWKCYALFTHSPAEGPLGFTFLTMKNKVVNNTHVKSFLGFLGGSGKESAYQCRRNEFNPSVWKIPWRRKWQPTQIFLPGKCHGQEKKAW